MLEVVLGLVVLGLIAALGLPFIRPGGGATALRAKAFEIAALLRTDRNATLRSGRASTVLVDAATGVIRSERSAAVVTLPAAMTLRLSATSLPGFRFYADGRASGGELALVSGKSTIGIVVSGPTAAVSIVDAADAPH